MKGEGLPLSPFRGRGDPLFGAELWRSDFERSEQIFEIWPLTKWGKLSQNPLFFDFRGPNFSLTTSF